MMESDAVGNGAADDRIEVVVESAGTSSNDEVRREFTSSQMKFH